MLRGQPLNILVKNRARGVLAGGGAGAGEDPLTEGARGGSGGGAAAPGGGAAAPDPGESDAAGEIG